MSIVMAQISPSTAWYGHEARCWTSPPIVKPPHPEHWDHQPVVR
jgi:hypothetical protein